MSHVLRAQGKGPGEGSETALAEISERQRGVAASWQLRQIGITRHMLAHRVRHGWLHRRFHGVYLVGSAVPALGAPEVAAVLACSRPAVLAGASAAWLWGFGPEPDEAHVLMLAGHARSRPGLRVHQSRTLLRADLRRRGGLPVTSPLRTLIDLANDGCGDLERALSDAHALGLVDAETLERELGARRGHHGLPQLLAMAASERSGFTRSQSERRLRELCRQAGLPPPKTNVKLCGWEVDFFWPQAGLVVEVDAFSTHGHRAQYVRDHRKQADLVAARYLVLRFTGWQLHHDVPRTIARLTQALYGPTRRVSDG